MLLNFYYLFFTLFFFLFFFFFSSSITLNSAFLPCPFHFQSLFWQLLQDYCTMSMTCTCKSTGTVVIFQYPFHPHITAVGHKRSQSFCQKCRWQVTAKHAYTWCIHVALHEVTWCMVVWCTQNLCRDGLCGTSHASTVSTPLWWRKKKMRYKKLVTHVEPHTSTVSLLEKVENSAIWLSAIINQLINHHEKNNLYLFSPLSDS